jgi:hypothetical protein
MQAREEVASGFFVAGGDASELFDKIEKALDEIAFGVEGEVAIARDPAIRFGGMAGTSHCPSRPAPTANAIRAFFVVLCFRKNGKNWRSTRLSVWNLLSSRQNQQPAAALRFEA